MAEEEGIECLDIKADKDLVDVCIRGAMSNIKKVKLPRLLLEAEHIINVPILKAHASMVFSGALKNIKGVVQDKVHLDMHQENLAGAMMDVWWATRADISIMDIWNPAAGFGPHTPVPLHVGVIAGSYDPVAWDRVACDIVGIDPDGVDYFAVAEEAGYGTTDMNHIEVVGEPVENCYKKMWIPYLGGMDRWPEYTICKDGACSSCQAMLSLNMETLRAIGTYDDHTDMVVVIGYDNDDNIPKDVPDDHLVLHGRCTRKYLKDHPGAFWIKGCPPAEVCLYMTVDEGRLLDFSEPAYMRDRMAKDHPIWEQYVYDQAEAFYNSAK